MTAPLLETRGLTIRFGGLVAVSDLNLRIAAGELVGLIGPNGAGKTTVFNLITGVYRPTGGEILLDGRPIHGRDPHQIHALGLARTFQNIRLCGELTVLDNLRIAYHDTARYGLAEALFRPRRFGREEERVIADARELLAAFGLAEAAGEKARHLPYGMQRRLEIARALASRPRLLLLDEPAAGMNPGEIEELMRFIRRIRSEFSVTILLIEHQMRLVMGICERITVLDFGATIAEGNPERVRRDPKVLAAYLGEEPVPEAGSSASVGRAPSPDDAALPGGAAPTDGSTPPGAPGSEP